MQCISSFYLIYSFFSFFRTKAQLEQERQLQDLLYKSISQQSHSGAGFQVRFFLIIM